MTLNPIWHTVSFDIEGVAKSSLLPQITTLVPCDNEKDALDYLNRERQDLLIGMKVINLAFTNTTK